MDVRAEEGAPQKTTVFKDTCKFGRPVVFLKGL